jgi:septum formation protein
MKINYKIVLCSASPRRQQLLKELGFNIEILVKEFEESFPGNLPTEEVALFLAEKKAMACRDEFKPDHLYITADTIVWLEGDVIGKPVDKEEAFRMLNKLSGNTHRVYTGVCLSNLWKKKSIIVKSDVKFRNLGDQEIKFYIDHYKPFDKAGSYGAQECLPPDMNPCSTKELQLLKSINKTDLFERTLVANQPHMPIIEKISGSYFNVMGLPIAELWAELAKWEEG